MNRQVLLIDYFGDKPINDDTVIVIGKAAVSALDDKMQIHLFSPQDIARLLLSHQPENHKQPSIIPVDLEKATNYVQVVVGDPAKTGEYAYIDKLYKTAIEMMTDHSDKSKLYKNALEVIIKFNKMRPTGSYKVTTSYLRDRGFTSKIVEAIETQYKLLSTR